MDTHYLRFVWLMIVIACSLWLSACNSYERYGDARIVQTASILFMGDTYIEYPKIPIGAPTMTSFRVPRDPCISGLALDVPTGEVDPKKSSQPWRHATIRVTLIAGDGDVIYKRTINFATDWDGRSFTGKHGNNRQIYVMLPHPPLPSASSYKFNVEVIRSSGRTADHLRVMTGI